MLGGEDVNEYRDVAEAAIYDLNNLLRTELGLAVHFSSWDFRHDLPRVEPAGGLPSRSLDMVDRAELVLAILGPTVPPITRQELHRAFENRAQGKNHLSVKVLLQEVEDAHQQLLDEIRVRFREEIVYAQYTDKLQFYRKAFATLVEHAAPHLQSEGGHPDA